MSEQENVIHEHWLCDSCGEPMRKPAGSIKDYPDDFSYFLCPECLKSHIANEHDCGCGVCGSQSWEEVIEEDYPLVDHWRCKNCGFKV